MTLFGYPIHDGLIVMNGVATASWGRDSKPLPPAPKPQVQPDSISTRPCSPSKRSGFWVFGPKVRDIPAQGKHLTQSAMLMFVTRFASKPR